MSADSSASRSTGRFQGSTKIVVLTTVMLTFISYWRASAVVLNDVGSSGYYTLGIAEHAIGKAAPWFIIAVLLFALGVRAVYIESCSMFVRGGVYRIVREAMGRTMAKLAVSALVFDFVLTGPISVTTAGHYVHSLFEMGAQYFKVHFAVPADTFSVFFSLIVTVYFWWLNIKGIEESSDRALKIMKVTFIMVAILITWSIVTVVIKRPALPPFSMKVDEEAMGWLSGFEFVKSALPILIFVGFGHSLLAMSGEETLAQVYREIEAPKLKNLIRAAKIIFVFCMIFTGGASFFAVMIVPDEVRHTAGDNMLTSLVAHLYGTGPVFAILKLLLTAFVVGVGGLLLSGAVNTSIIGSNGVINRIAEDGVLPDWFRHPHRRFGTSYRIINLIVVLQLFTIIASRGNVTLLGEAYAFGVVWSFFFMTISMFLLRFKYKGIREWKVPLNPRIAGREIPLGLGFVTLVLVITATTNLLTKKVATISGLSFTLVLFCILWFCEWYTHRQRQKTDTVHEHREKFLLDHRTEITPSDLKLPEGRKRVLVPIRDPGNLIHLKKALEESHEQGTELIVMTIKVERGDTEFQHVFTPEEERLFTRVVELAEKYGETIAPIVIPSNNSWFAMARTAKELEVEELFMGKSERVPADVQVEQMAIMWAMVSTGSEKPLTVRIVAPEQEYSVTL